MQVEQQNHKKNVTAQGVSSVRRRRKKHTICDCHYGLLGWRQELSTYLYKPQRTATLSVTVLVRPAPQTLDRSCMSGIFNNVSDYLLFCLFLYVVSLSLANVFTLQVKAERGATRHSSNPRCSARDREVAVDL